MLKLTTAHGDRVCFVNPRLITDITPRTVRDTSLDKPKGVRAVTPGYRIEGCLICFGGPEDSACAVMEAAEEVAIETAAYNKAGGWGIVDVALQAQARAENAAAEEKLRAEAECTGKPDCKCIVCDLPF